jgi:hypothetical protein
MNTEELNQAAQSSMEALKEEYPGRGVIVIITEATGQFSLSTNINKVAAADLMVHVSKHLKDECRC